MIPFIALTLANGGTALIKTTEISGATSAPNDNATVYVTGWAEKGIVVDLNVEEFAEVWMTALFDEVEVEYEITRSANELH